MIHDRLSSRLGHITAPGSERTAPIRPELCLADSYGRCRPLADFENFVNLSRQCARLGDIEQVMALAGERTRQILQVESVSIILPSRRKNELFFRLVQGPGEKVRQEILRATFPSSQSLAGLVLNTGRPLHIREVRTEAKFFSGVDLKSGFVTKNLIYAPLMTGNRARGVLGAVNKLDGEFSAQDRTMASLLADLVALHLENARTRDYEAAVHTDPLTGLANRRYLSARLKDELHRAQRNRTNFSVIFIDLDKFKAINDNHGHRAGDLALCALAGVLRQETRVTDTAVRYGGDEFVILLPETDAAEAALLAARLRKAVLRAEPPESLPKFTASFGISTYSPEKSTGDEFDLVRQADLAMLQAKHGGGNKVSGEIHRR